MPYTLEVTGQELDAILDALNKGASRHESFAKFYNNNATLRHKAMARIMRDLQRRFGKLD